MDLKKAFYNCLLNPVMNGLLHSPLHGLVSGNIAILHFTGRKSGRALNTPLSYVREGDKVLFLSNQNTGWWKNFRDGEAPVEVEIRRVRHPGTALLMEGDSEALRDGVTRFLKVLPRDALVYGIRLDKSKRPTESSLAAAAPGLVVVEVTLD
jgi:hypothetical protein